MFWTKNKTEMTILRDRLTILEERLRVHEFVQSHPSGQFRDYRFHFNDFCGSFVYEYVVDRTVWITKICDNIYNNMEGYVCRSGDIIFVKIMSIQFERPNYYAFKAGDKTATLLKIEPNLETAEWIKA